MLTLYGCKKDEIDIENHATIVVAKTVKYDEKGNEDIWEVHRNIENSAGDTCYIVNNGEITQTKNIVETRNSTEIMKEPHLDEIGGIDISGNEQIAYNTWQTKLEEAYGYVKYFIENDGYKVWFKGISSDYSEIYLIKKGNTGGERYEETEDGNSKEEIQNYSDVKRIIITEDTISIGNNIDINDIKFKLGEVTEYIGK